MLMTRTSVILILLFIFGFLASCSGSSLEKNSNNALLNSIDSYKTRPVISSDSQTLLTALYDQELVRYDIDSGQLLNSTPKLAEDAPKLVDGSIICQSKTGSVVVTYSQNDGTAKVWDGKTLALSREFVISEGNDPTVINLDMSPDGHYLATSFEYAPNVQIWDISTGKIMYELSAQIESRFSAEVSFQFSNNSKFIYITHTATESNVWSLETGEIIFTPESNANSAKWDLGFSEDGNAIRYFTGDALKTVDLITGEVISNYSAEYDKSEILVLPPLATPDGERLFITEGIDTDAPSVNWEYYTIKLWDLPTQSVLNSFGEKDSEYKSEFNILHNRPYRISLSADNAFLKVFFGGEGLSIWDTKTGILIYNGLVREGQFSPDSNRLVVQTTRDTFETYDLGILRNLALK